MGGASVRVPPQKESKDRVDFTARFLFERCCRLGFIVMEGCNVGERVSGQKIPGVPVCVKYNVSSVSYKGLTYLVTYVGNRSTLPVCTNTHEIDETKNKILYKTESKKPMSFRNPSF